MGHYKVAWMSLRQKYLKLLSEIMPAGAVGISLLLGSAGPGEAARDPAEVNPAAGRSTVAERLAAIRDAARRALRRVVNELFGKRPLVEIHLVRI